MIDTIIQGDCLEVMRDMTDESIDLVVTSPPYDNLRTYDDMCEWNFDIFKSIATELYRIIKIGGVIVWVVGDATINGSETGTSFKQALYFKDIGFNLHDTMIYNRISPFPANVRYNQDFEYMFIFSRESPKSFNPLRENKSEKEIARILQNSNIHVSNTYRNKDGTINNIKNNKNAFDRLKLASTRIDKIKSNVWKINSGYLSNTKDKIAYEHPATFPEKLAKDQILSWSNEYDLILDPFIGSGTTAIACIETNRHYIGIEINPDYCDIANKRIGNHKEQLKIF